MPNDADYQAVEVVDTRIYRQIIVIYAQSDPKDFRRFQERVRGLLKGVRFELLADKAIPELGLDVIELAAGEDVAGVLALLNSDEHTIWSAEQNRQLRLAQAAVNDPLYWDQWALRKMSAEPAWQRAIDAGAGPVVVGIVDSGISTTHPDLVGHLWTDGAGNHGHNVLTNTSDVWDSRGHGTMLAGTVGAISNNAVGIAGAGWPVQLMAVKFIDENTSPDTLNSIHGIWWACTHGATV